MGQGTPEIKKMESKERSKIVNFQILNYGFRMHQQTLNQQTFKKRSRAKMGI